MFFSFRVHRRLGFYDALPSGWFVVWFCSLLGLCHVLFPLPPEPLSISIQWPTQFGASCDGGMLPLSLPPLYPDAAEQKRWELSHDQHWKLSHGQQRLWELPYKTAAELDTLWQWHNVRFAGAPITDFLAFASAIQAVKSMQADSSHKSGVRIFFQPHATFSSLVATLDMLSILDQKRYWLAIRSEPLILYSITVEPPPEPMQPTFL
jgi:hypothetical protein